MSVLAWLFGLGTLAVAFPLLFHLIRRTPKGQTEFSSLMFLSPSPPTFTRRSRLDNWLLLLMRMIAIALIAFAFMRPFFRGAEQLTMSDVASRRVAILLDTSASMQRAELWTTAVDQVRQTLDALEPNDEVALYRFDEDVGAVVGFGLSENAGELDGQPAREQILRELATLEPSYARSDLGKALVALGDELTLWQESQRTEASLSRPKMQIVVISDLQKGTEVDALQAYQWPPEVFVKFEAVQSADMSNATVSLLDSGDEADADFRVRVANAASASEGQFAVSWTADNGQTGKPLDFYVPPGTSRVLKLARDKALRAESFRLSGDTAEFDNQFFLVPPQQQQLEIGYLGGEDVDDPDRPLFYLQRSLIETPSRKVTIRSLDETDWATSFLVPDSELGVGAKSIQAASLTLTIVTRPVPADQVESLQRWVENGGTALLVLLDDETTASLAELSGAQAKQSQARQQDDYRMLAELKFDSPLLRPFANPKFNDFTKIRFWRHQAVELDSKAEAEVIARFDNDDPAIWRRAIGQGQVFTLASGWQPEHSQLALSSKFLPLIAELVELSAKIPQLRDSLLVGQPLRFPAGVDGKTRTLIKPDQNRVPIASDETEFAETDLPGIYRLQNQSTAIATVANENGIARGNEFLFAVNVDRAESETEPLAIEQLESLGVKVGQQTTGTESLTEMRAIRDQDLEERQKVWKWLIVAAICLLIGETWLAGRTGRTVAQSSSQGSQPAYTSLSGEAN